MAAEAHAEQQQVIWIFDQHPKLQNNYQSSRLQTHHQHSLIWLVGSCAKLEQNDKTINMCEARALTDMHDYACFAMSTEPVGHWAKPKKTRCQSSAYVL